LIELSLNLIGKTSRFTPVTLIWPSKSRVTDDEVNALKNAYDSGQLSNTTYFSKLLAIDWETEQENILREQQFMLDKEVEIQKIKTQREALREKTGTNEMAVNDNEADDKQGDENADVNIEELFRPTRNGKNHRLEFSFER
jgi:hypothetical protein